MERNARYAGKSWVLGAAADGAGHGAAGARAGSHRRDTAGGGRRQRASCRIRVGRRQDHDLRQLHRRAARIGGRFTGTPLPFRSTVTLGGEWSLAAAPRLTGSLAIRREGGDVFFARSATSDATIAAGITALEGVARFTDDAIDATASFRSTRGDSGRCQARHRHGRGRAARTPGRRCPARFLGHRAICRRCSCCNRGSAAPRSSRDALTSTSRRAVPWGARRSTGTLKGEDLRIDAPQHGLHFTNGRLVAHAADGRIVIEEIVLAAGTGTFRASGDITGLATGGERPVARLAWRAENFRAFNRPDLRLVVGGEGTAVAESGKVSLAGKLRIDEGAIVYLATPDATLGDDVVVKGWPRRTGRERARGGCSARRRSDARSRRQARRFRARGSRRACRAWCRSRPARAGSSARARSVPCAAPTSRSASSLRSTAGGSSSTDASTIRRSTSWRCARISPSRPA